jgi:hypothetical protein
MRGRRAGADGVRGITPSESTRFQYMYTLIDVLRHKYANIFDILPFMYTMGMHP